jgi:hypothetical protein
MQPMWCDITGDAAPDEAAREAPDPRRSFEHRHGTAGLGQQPAEREAGGASAENDDALAVGWGGVDG